MKFIRIAEGIQGKEQDAFISINHISAIQDEGDHRLIWADNLAYRTYEAVKDILLKISAEERGFSYEGPKSKESGQT